MFNISKVTCIVISFTAVHIYDFHIFSHLCQCISVSKLWVYIGISVRSFIIVAFQLILITQVVSSLQEKLEYKWRKKATRKTMHFIYRHFLNRTWDQWKLQAMTEYYDIEYVLWGYFLVFSFLIRRISNIRYSSFLGHFLRIAKFSRGLQFLDCVVCTTMQYIVFEVAAGVTCMVSQERFKAFCFVFYLNKYRHLSYWKSLFICLQGEIYNFVLLCFVLF